MTVTIAADIRRYIEENFLFRGDSDALGDTDSLLAAGLIDSTGVLELVAFLEERYGLKVPDADIVPRNFDSVAGLAAFVQSCLAPATPERVAGPVADHAD